MSPAEPDRRCEVCNRIRPPLLVAMTLRPTGVVGERLVVTHCADRLVCRAAAGSPGLWQPGSEEYFDE